MALSVVGSVVLAGGGALLASAHDRPLTTGGAVSAQGAGPVHLVHVLADACPCSRAIAEHLIRRHRWAGADVTESVQVICEGSPSEPELIARLREAGFPVTTPTLLEAHVKLGVNGGPVLVIFRKDGTRAYSGGYASARPTESTADADFRDVAIATECLAGREVKRLPALGCTSGKSAQDAWRDVVQLPLSDR